MSAKTVYIKFYTNVNQNSVQKLMDAIEEKLKEGANKFALLISIRGGTVFDGITAYNYLKGIPAELVTHNFASPLSTIASLLFCAGGKRYCSPHATFLLHSIQTKLQHLSTGGLEEKQLEERLKKFKLDMENIIGILAEATGKKEEEIRKDMLASTTLTAKQAVKYGLAHEIREPLLERGAELVSIQ